MGLETMKNPLLFKPISIETDISRAAKFYCIYTSFEIDCNYSKNFPFFQINGEKMESEVNFKYLGVQIDASLNWKVQINLAIGKISRGIGMLKYSKSHLPLQTI